MTRPLRACEVCGAAYHPTGNSQRVCSDTCDTKRKAERNRRWYVAHRDEILARERARVKTPEGRAKKRAQAQRWRSRNVERERAVARARYARDPQKEMQKTLRWRERNPGASAKAARKTRYKQKYGVSLTSVEEIIATEHCPICWRPLASVKKPVVDHDHKTGAARAVLCSDCNTGLGMFDDNWERLFAAHLYVLGKRKNRRELVAS